ncbi:LA_2272 family surface repeat-containing protein [Flavobacterium sp.]|uniref:LA_2272 family surface repeat-containing protein n=1 Tax=Flavobacterium sp. TaxID=239 RepID=UPI003753232F
MKKLTLISIFFSLNIFAQNVENKLEGKTVRNIFSFIPSNVDKVNGLSLGVWAENLKSAKDSLKINGINLEINPIIFFVYIRGGIYIPNIDNDLAYVESRKFNLADIDGLNLSVPGFSNTSSKINGLSLTPFTMCAGEINGITISGITNCSYNLNGISICGIYNSSNQVKGLQIGLFNRAKKLRGFQIGLWNKNGKRSLPFLNWQFSD